MGVAHERDALVGALRLQLSKPNPSFLPEGETRCIGIGCRSIVWRHADADTVPFVFFGPKLGSSGSQEAGIGRSRAERFRWRCRCFGSASGGWRGR
jgi:hypothetical protein